MGKSGWSQKGKCSPHPQVGEPLSPALQIWGRTQNEEGLCDNLLLLIFFFHFCIHLMGLKFYGGLICTSSFLRTPLKLSETLFPWESSWPIWDMGTSSSNTDPEKTEAPIYFYCTFVYRKAVCKPSSKEEIAFLIPENLKCFYYNQLFTI